MRSTRESRSFLFIGCRAAFSLVFLSSFPSFSTPAIKPLPHPFSDDIIVARRLHQEEALSSPAEIAKKTLIGQNYKALLQWMHDDLAQYLVSFEAIFAAKLERIRRHQVEREADLAGHTVTVRARLNLDPANEADLAELQRLTELHKAQAFIGSYLDSKDFIEKYVGPKGKTLKSHPTDSEIRLMNQPGEKLLYVDTWAVPFFNTGTQTVAQAKEGVRQALERFRGLDLQSDISLYDFTRLMAIFARPEFDDVRRYKLIPFPDENDLSRFGLERSDARTFGSKFPEEALVVINRPVDLGPVSFIFGQRLSIFGLISHSRNDNTADGRVFTGPADFLEHDYAHAFFNLMPAIPGTPAEWEEVSRAFMLLRDAESNPQNKRMMRLVFYHFTHESGFRVLLPDDEGRVDLAKFRNELNTIVELIHTRHHYDFILGGNAYPDGYRPYLDYAFALVGNFFKDHFVRIQNTERIRAGLCETLTLNMEPNDESQ